MNKGIKDSTKKTKMLKINIYKQYIKEREEANKTNEDHQTKAIKEK